MKKRGDYHHHHYHNTHYVHDNQHQNNNYNKNNHKRPLPSLLLPHTHENTVKRFSRTFALSAQAQECVALSPRHSPCEGKDWHFKWRYGWWWQCSMMMNDDIGEVLHWYHWKEAGWVQIGKETLIELVGLHTGKYYNHHHDSDDDGNVTGPRAGKHYQNFFLWVCFGAI